MCDIAEAVFNWDLASSPASSESGNMLGVERNSSTQVEVRLGGRRKVERKVEAALVRHGHAKTSESGHIRTIHCASLSMYTSIIYR
jgi:hypothetical protein